MDTSGKTLSVALSEENKLLGEVFINGGNTHSVSLMPAIDYLLQACGVAIQDLDAVALASGPGSYTGLRIGICTAKGLAHPRNIPCIGVNTLHALAVNVSSHRGYICPVMDARRGEVYNAVYDNTDGRMKNLIPPRGINIHQLLAEQRDNHPLYLGDGTYLEAVAACGANVAPRELLLQRASSVCALAFLQGQTTDYKTLEPDYLREFSL